MTSRRSAPKPRLFVALSVAIGLALPAPAASDAQQARQGRQGRQGEAGAGASDPALRARALIAGLDYDEARRVLEAADASDPSVAVERARLATYELDCDGAVAIFSRAEVQRAEGGDQLADIARGCQRVTAALAADTDDVRHIQVLWQDEHDRALAPLLFDTVERARNALSRDLGVDWPRPTRVVVVRDLLSLSAMTGLPYRSAQTTGTVAVAKWGRVTLLSPRATRHGYTWRDTIAHELTHLAVTRASGDRAPLWLQEGVAKNEEVRWRDPGPFDDRPPPEAVTQRGAELGLTLPLDKLGPSVAMLPSADAAAVAFAEVTSFVRFYAQSGTGNDTLRGLLRELKEGKEPDAALVAASGADLKTWDARWRAYLASRPRVALPGLYLAGRAHGGAEGMRQLRDRSRLAQLLLARGHAEEALTELGSLAFPGAASDSQERTAGDPGLRWLSARAFEDAGRRSDGEPLVADPKELASSFGPWWAMRGRWARARGDEKAATESFFEALAADPLDPEAACESLDPGETPAEPSRRALCEAAGARAEPPFDSD